MPTDPNHSTGKDQRQRRRDNLRDVLADARIEGLTVGGATETLLEAAVDGEIDEAELIARVRKLHGLL